MCVYVCAAAMGHNIVWLSNQTSKLVVISAALLSIQQA